MPLSPFIPPSPLPPWAHKSILYICISIPPLEIGSSVPLFYISYVCINIQHLFFLFLIYFTLYDRHSVHPDHDKWADFDPFHSWVIFHCTSVPHLLYPFILVVMKISWNQITVLVAQCCECAKYPLIHTFSKDEVYAVWISSIDNLSCPPCPWLVSLRTHVEFYRKRPGPPCSAGSRWLDCTWAWPLCRWPTAPYWGPWLLCGWGGHR